METPVQVTFRNIPVSDAVEAECWEEVKKLERYHDRIVSCRVVLEEPHRRHHRGNLYAVKLVITVPGKELVVNREPPPEHQADKDIFVAIREAFDTARRLLEEHARRQRGFVKAHHGPPHGRVGRLFASEGYGYIETLDGREVYFHRNSVVNGGFDGLREGDEVRFVEEAGEEGPQASTVSVVGRHGRE
jgi:cold shock CspA family protein